MQEAMNIRRRERSHLRETALGLQLVADRIDHKLQFPPSDFYLGEVPTEHLLAPIGSLYSFTLVHNANGSCYGLGMVDFEGGVRVFGPLVSTGRHHWRIGEHVRVVAHELADGSGDYAFVPAGDIR